ncbi:MAG: hypothetical protein HQK85_00145 [Nitrospinae bacterium]|nr:hypothetical protein [Nitrospinota bacterium]
MTLNGSNCIRGGCGEESNRRLMNRLMQTAQDKAPKTDDGGNLRWHKGLEQTAVVCSPV